MKTEDVVLMGVGMAAVGFAAWKFGLLDRVKGTLIPYPDLTDLSKNIFPEDQPLTILPFTRAGLPSKTTEINQPSNLLQNIFKTTGIIDNSMTVAPTAPGEKSAYIAGFPGVSLNLSHHNLLSEYLFAE